MHLKERALKTSTKLMYLFWVFSIFLMVMDNHPKNFPLLPANYFLVTTIASGLLVFAWFLADAKELDIRPSPLLKVSVVACAGLAVPYYLIKYKGQKQFLKSFGKFLLLLLGSLIIMLIITSVIQDA